MKIPAPVLWGREETRDNRWRSHMESSLSLLSTKCFLSPVPQPKSEGMAGTGYTIVQMNIGISNHKNPVNLCNGRDLTVFSGWNSSYKGSYTITR